MLCEEEGVLCKGKRVFCEEEGGVPCEEEVVP